MQASSQNQEHSVNTNDEVNCKEHFLCSFDPGLGCIIVAMIDQHGEVGMLNSTGCTIHKILKTPISSFVSLAGQECNKMATVFI